MAGNPYKINIAQPDLSPVMSGIGSLIKESRDKAKKQKLGQDFKTAMDSNDFDTIMKFGVENPEASGMVSNVVKFKNEGTRKNMAQTLVNLDRNPDNYAEYLNQRNDYLISQGADPKDTQEALTRFAENPEAELQQARNLMPFILNKQEMENFKSGKVDPEFLKEERKNAAQSVKSFDRQAKEMRTSYGKLQSLAEQARTGDRGARNAMTVAVGRLMSPGIFTETEASALSGGQNSLQAIFSALAGKGVDIEALKRNIDPYGDSFNVDGLLNIGQSIVASSRQPLIDMYEGSRDRATRSNMGERAFNTNFGDNQNYEFLQGFGADEAAPLPNNVPPEAMQRLQDNPELIDDFVEMYGVRPEGF